MKQLEAVIQAMEARGGFATFAQLYQDALNISDCQWKTKTPFASIRRIVQDERFFFKIRPGLWALKSRRDDVLKILAIDPKASKVRKDEFSHTYYQGLIVEIGNIKGFRTFIPYQDKNKNYLSKPLSQYSTLKTIYDYSFPEIVKMTISIDVSWFNERSLPDSFFEVEHTTNIERSLSKFLELQDFNVKFNIVASKIRKREFGQKILSTAFKPIRERINFIDYDNLSNYHAKIFAFHDAQKEMPI